MMNSSEIIQHCETALQDALFAIQQPRTDFQLRHFVVGQHDCEPRRWMQCVLELSIKIHSLKRAQIEQRRTKRKIEQLKADGTPDSRDEAALLELDCEQHALAMIGAMREAQILLAIFQSFPRGYTNEELNAAEAEYWQSRLARQAKHGLMATGRIGAGDLDALQQIGQPVTVETIRKLESELWQTKDAVSDLAPPAPSSKTPSICTNPT